MEGDYPVLMFFTSGSNSGVVYRNADKSMSSLILFLNEQMGRVPTAKRQVTNDTSKAGCNILIFTLYFITI